ncbi:MAG TPA: tRNA lysidine(34) synthetase TilS [Pseudomonadales bacterium]|nr:tRNA lysidine(34) synthetase TilS [Pseudomonadales bacterium]
MHSLAIALDPLPSSSRLIVGLSGGLDSCVLLHRLAAESSLHSRLIALHIHHGLSPNADAWAQHCQAVATQLGVTFIQEKVQVDRDVASLELAARSARYAAFAKHLQQNDVLVTAHHQNDQAETFILRLMRGAGVDGLSAMKIWSAQRHYFVWRPFLPYSRSELEQYAAAHQLQWVDDESNLETQFDRNFVRLKALPLLQQRWPHAVNAIARASINLQDSQQLLAEFMQQDLQRYTDGARLNWLAIKDFSAVRINAILRGWLHANAVLAPSVAQLAAIRQMMFTGKWDATPQFDLPNVSLRRYRELLYILPREQVEVINRQADLLPLRWGDALPVGKLLAYQSETGAGACNLAVPLEQLSIRFPSGATRLHLAHRSHSSDLKKLLQAAGCPPWLRRFLPLLYLGEALVCVPGIGVAEGWQADAGAPGWRFQWDQFGGGENETRA